MILGKQTPFQSCSHACTFVCPLALLAALVLNLGLAVTWGLQALGGALSVANWHLRCEPRSAGIKTCSISAPTETLSDGQVIALCAVLPLSSIDELTFHNLNLVGPMDSPYVQVPCRCNSAAHVLQLYGQALRVQLGITASGGACMQGTALLLRAACNMT